MGDSLGVGLIDWDLGAAENAELWFRRATYGSAADQDQPGAARAWAQLAEIAAVEGRGRDAVDAAGQALRLAADGTAAERLAWIHRSLGEAMQHGGRAGIDCLNRRLAADPELVPGREVDMLVTRASLGYYSGQPQSTLAELRVVLRRARRGSVPVQLARCHFLMAAALTVCGDWDDALVHAHTALSVASDDQQLWVQPQCHAVLGILLAYRGDEAGAENHVTRATLMAANQDNLEAAGTARLAAAALAHVQQKSERVIEELVGLASSPPMLSGLYFWPRHNYGRFLCSRGDRRRGIDQLRAARHMLSAAGAEPFVAQVDTDLSAADLPAAATSASRSMLVSPTASAMWLPSWLRV